MFEIIVVLLIVMWLLGMVTSHTIGGFIPIRLLLAIVPVRVRIIQGRAPL